MMGTMFSGLDTEKESTGSVWTDLGQICKAAGCPSVCPCICPEDDEAHEAEEIELVDLKMEDEHNYTPFQHQHHSSSDEDPLADVPSPSSSMFNDMTRTWLESQLYEAKVEDKGVKHLVKKVKLPNNYKIHPAHYALIRYSSSTDNWYAAPDMVDRNSMKALEFQTEEKKKKKAEKAAARQKKVKKMMKKIKKRTKSKSE